MLIMYETQKTRHNNRDLKHTVEISGYEQERPDEKIFTENKPVKEIKILKITQASREIHSFISHQGSPHRQRVLSAFLLFAFALSLPLTVVFKSHRHASQSASDSAFYFQTLAVHWCYLQPVV